MYDRLKPADFFTKMQTEEDARNYFWRAKFQGRDFLCPHCGDTEFYGFAARPEVRRCGSCARDIRLRSHSILQRSKIPLLMWLRAIFFLSQDKRGVSALQLMRQLGLSSFDTAWHLLHKVRRALASRDEQYLLHGIVELDGSSMDSEARRKTKEKRTYPPESEVLVAVETKDWFDERGRPKHGAGFAKVVVRRETTIFAKQFAEKALEPGTQIHTDAAGAFRQLPQVTQQKMKGEPERLESWLPWVYRYVSNAKTWLMGTHHGVSAKYLPNYMAEYTYRFNRRHDPDSMLHRIVTACVLAEPVTRWALTG